MKIVYYILLLNDTIRVHHSQERERERERERDRDRDRDRDREIYERAIER